MPFFPVGRRWFTTASWATVVVALLHTLGNTLSAPPADAAYTTLETTMKGYTVPLGLGMSPSMWDINQSLVFTMSIALATMGPLWLCCCRDRTETLTPGLLRPAAVVLTVASLALTALFAVYQVTPALVSMAVVSVLYLVAVVEARRSDAGVWR